VEDQRSAAGNYYDYNSKYYTIVHCAECWENAGALPAPAAAVRVVKSEASDKTEEAHSGPKGNAYDEIRIETSVEDPAAYADLRSYYFDAQDEMPKEGVRQTRGKKAPPRISRHSKKIQLQLQQLDEGPLKEHREALILLRQLRYFESVGACRKEYPPWHSVLTDPDFHEVVDLCDSDEEMPPVVDAEEFLLGAVNEKGFVTTEVVKADPDAATLAEEGSIGVAVKEEAEGDPEEAEGNPQ